MKYYTLNGAMEKANDSDTILCKIGDMTISGVKDKIIGDPDSNLPYMFATSDYWQIIPAAPVVLSTEEIVRKIKHYKQLTEFSLEQVFKIVDLAIKTGRVERDLEIQPFFDVIKSQFCDEDEMEDPESMYKIFQAFDKVPPLIRRQ